ncbi:MAG: hypothetical protein IT287_09795, partial [Bdellovibrionaceae bacterium]|nr:hypothetical protein [Pseudobdellovibrionaceae bacterium]
GAFIIRTKDGALGTTEKLRIDYAGNVGIGTTSPSTLLSIEKNATTLADLPSLKVSNSNPVAGDGVTTRNLAAISLQAGNGNVSGGLVIANETAGFYGDKLFLRTLTYDPLSFGTNGLERMYIHRDGNVGIGTTVPGSKLEVVGQIASRGVDLGSGTTFDWSTGNNQYTTANCGAFTFTGMIDGGSYALAVKGATSTTCSFSHAGLTFRMPPDHSATLGGTHTFYTFTRMGTDVYVAWTKGY